METEIKTEAPPLIPSPTQVVLTAEEYEALRAGAAQSQTVTISKAEYDQLTAQKGDTDKLVAELDRWRIQCRNLETQLKLEQADHWQEYEALMKAFKARGG